MGDVILFWSVLIIQQFDLIANLIGGRADIMLDYYRLSIGPILEYRIGVPCAIPPLLMDVDDLCRCLLYTSDAADEL